MNEVHGVHWYEAATAVAAPAPASGPEAGSAVSEIISARRSRARLELRNRSLARLVAQRDLFDQRCGNKCHEACHHGEPED